MCSILNCSFFVLRINKVCNSCIYSKVIFFNSYIGNVITSSKIIASSITSSLCAIICDWGVLSVGSDTYSCFPFALKPGIFSCWVDLTYCIGVRFKVLLSMALNSCIRSWITSCSLGFSMSFLSLLLPFSHLFYHLWHE